MVKAVFVFVLLGLIAVNSVSAELKCYICEDCDSVNDEQSKECTADNLYETVPETTEAPTTTTEAIEPTTVETTTETATDTSPTAYFREEKADATTAAPSAYKCFKITIKGDKPKTIRGCTLTTKQCEAVQKDKNGENCNICDTENCNPASNIQSWAFTSVVLLAIVKMFF